jgi:hypothetical protein
MTRFQEFILCTFNIIVGFITFILYRFLTMKKEHKQIHSFRDNIFKKIVKLISNFKQEIRMRAEIQASALF